SAGVAVRRYLTDLNINPEFVEILSPQNIRDITTIIVEGDNSAFYEIRAHLESSDEVAMRFLDWVQSGKVRAITNRSVFKKGESWFEFLIVSKSNPDEINEDLKVIDPELKLVELVSAASMPAALDEDGDPPTGGEGGPAGGNAAPPAPSGPGAAGADGSDGGPRAAMAPAPAHPGLSATAVDGLLTHVGDLVVASGLLNHLSGDERPGQALSALRAMIEDLRGGGHAEADLLAEHLTILDDWRARLSQVEHHVSGALGRLQGAALELREVTIEEAFAEMVTLTGELSAATAKPARLVIEGNTLRIDRGIAETLAEPLRQMLRNAFEHGIEAAAERQGGGKPAESLLVLRAHQEAGRLELTLTDDGAGIDDAAVRERIAQRGLAASGQAQALAPRELHRFLFVPGFTTRDSHRGVGLDLVFSTAARLGGSVEVESRPGQGTAMTLRLPQSAAIQQTLLVEAGGQTVAIPDRWLSAIHEASPGDVETVRGQRVLRLKEGMLPLFSLGDLLGRPGVLRSLPDYLPVLVLTDGQHRMGVQVDKLCRRQDLVVKDMHPQLAVIPGVGGASILGDGRVVLIVDGAGLFKLAAGRSE
ncbi:MAG: chemotaxis protein CheW, partial [Rhodospirillales bacterium]|nr:chemotaxis protein CheW [Rhodospirillales bacterium]